MDGERAGGWGRVVVCDRMGQHSPAYGRPRFPLSGYDICFPRNSSLIIIKKDERAYINECPGRDL